MNSPGRSWGVHISPELASQLDAALGKRVSIIVAPAGSGKSTILGELRSRLHGQRAILVDVTPGHSDLMTFAAELLDKLERATTRSSQHILTFAATLPEPDRQWRSVHRAITRELRRQAEPIFLLLDNFHNLEPDSAVANLLDELVRDQSGPRPYSLRIVIASRGAVPPAISRLRASGHLAELNAASLSLNMEQTVAVLAQAGVADSEALAGEVLRRTCGWATGVQLAATAMATLEPAEYPAFLESFSTHRDLFAYVAGEVVRGVPTPVVRCAELVALVGGATRATLAAIASSCPADFPGLTPEAALSACLAQGVDRGLLQATTAGFTIHQLWQDMLLGQLEARLEPEAWRRVRLARARALVGAQRFDEALAAFEKIGEYGGVSQILRSVGFDWVQAGRNELVLAWLRTLPAPLCNEDATLLHLEGTALMRGNPNAAIPRLTLAADAYARQGEGHKVIAVWESIALLHYCQGRWPELMQAMRHCMSLQSVLTEPGARGNIIVAVGCKAFFAGKYNLALQLFGVGERFPLHLVPMWSLDWCRLSLMRYSSEPEAALEVVDRALAQRTISDFAPAYFSLLGYRALFRAMAGRFEEADADFDLAHEALSEFRFTRLIAQVSFLRGQAHLIAGELEPALASFENSASQALECQDSGAQGQANAWGSFVLCLLGSTERASEVASRSFDQYRQALSQQRDMLPGGMLLPIWVLGRCGDSVSAWRLATTNRKLFDSPDLPVMHHTTRLLLADLARRAGDIRAATRLAREGWEFAAKARVTRTSVPLPSELLLWTAREALTSGQGAEAAFHRLRSSADQALMAMLAESLHDSRPDVRARAVDLLGRLGTPDAVALVRGLRQDQDAIVQASRDAALKRVANRPPAALRVTTLGRLQVLRGGKAIPDADFHGSMAKRLLLRLLVAHGNPVPRLQLQEDLWPDATPDAAAHNVRVALHRLVSALEPLRPENGPSHFIIATTPSLTLRRSQLVTWDVAEFLENVALAQAAQAAHQPAEALSRYRSAFANHHGRFAAEFKDEPWLDTLRFRFTEELLTAATRFATMLFETEQFEECLTLLEKVVQEEPSAESAWTMLVRVHLARFDRGSALRAYRRAVESLRESLGIEPSAELLELVAAVRRQRSSPGPSS